MVEALCSTPALEQISQEELTELGITLDKAKQNPELSLKLLRVLDRKVLTAQLLVDTKIGKRLSAVEEKGGPTTESEIIDEIKGLKERLKRRWTEVYKRTKPKAPEAPKKEAPVEITLPYFGDQGRKSFETGNQSRDFKIEKFILKLQTPTEKSASGKVQNYPVQYLVHAVEIAKELEKAIEDWGKRDEKLKSDKFRQLISVLNEKGRFREMLLNRDLSGEEIVKMKKEGFMTTEAKADLEAAETAKIQSARSDWIHEQNKEMAKKTEGFFTCKRCKSKKTTFYQQQTRGADEPMTNFITCLECGHQMKQ